MMDCEETRLYTVKVHDHLLCLHTGFYLFSARQKNIEAKATCKLAIAARYLAVD